MTTGTPHQHGSETDLSVVLHGLRLPNPFIIGSGPPSTNANVIAKAFDEGWGGVVAKTACLDHARIRNVSPRYARMRAPHSDEIIGWENIELISDRPFASWIDDYRRIKASYPDRVLIASIMEEYSENAWAEIIGRTQEAGVDALELNLSCPHGLPEQRMGSAMGQDPQILEEVCGWAVRHARVPVWAKLTPNVTDIAACGRAALRAGVHGLSAINTVLSVMSINLETLRPEPSVEGYSTPGGYSGKAVRPIALRMTMELGRVVGAEFPGRSLSALGGIETGEDAAQFILCGAHTTQVCTGVMIHGYRLLRDLRDQLEAFMFRHGFSTLDEFRGRALQYFTSHADLVARQAASRRAEAATVVSAPRADDDWKGDSFIAQSDALISR
ncbi:MAG: NAD-dependent dihydropyrimidine dehydrogenase subunit PreA [Phycisphaerales bacterium]